MNELLTTDKYWIVSVFAVVFFALLLDYLAKKFLVRLHEKLLQTDNPWDDILVEAGRPPVSLAVWVVGLTYAAEIIFLKTDAPLFEISRSVRYVGVVIAIAFFVIRFIKGVEKDILSRDRNDLEEARMDPSTVNAIAQLTRLSVIITACLVILQTLGFSISGILAFGGIGGIAVGFAAKDLLANFFGAMIVYLDRPFSVGDWIRSPDREIEGTVEYIGWRVTRIRTFDQRPLYVPNAIFTSIVVENPSRMSNRRIYETIGLRYDDVKKVDAVVAAVKDYLVNHSEIDSRRTLMVNFNAFAASSCDFFVYTFTKTTNWVRFHEVKQQILLDIADIIRRHGAEIAYPTSTLHIASGITDVRTGDTVSAASESKSQ